MTHFSIVRDASNALRDRLFHFLTTVPDVNFGLTNAATDIIVSAPDSTIPDGALLSAYLYHIEPDPQLRNQGPLSVGQTGLAKPPLALRHHFLITPLMAEEEQNQLVLGRIMQGFHDEPFIAELDGEPMTDSLGAGSPALRITIEPMTLEEMSRIWNAMGSDYRLSIAYLMRTILIDSASDPRQAGRVEQATIAVGSRG